MIKLLNKKAILIFISSATILALSIIFYIIITTTGIILKTNLKCNFQDEVYLKGSLEPVDIKGTKVI